MIPNGIKDITRNSYFLAARIVSISRCISILSRICEMESRITARESPPLFFAVTNTLTKFRTSSWSTRLAHPVRIWSMGICR